MKQSRSQDQRRHGQIAGAIVSTVALLGLAGCYGEISSQGARPGSNETPGGTPGVNNPVGQNNGSTPAPDKVPRPDVDPIGNASSMDDVCYYIDPGETPLNRLTQREYTNSVRALFPGLALDIPSVGQDEKVGPFDANVVSSVLDLQADQYRISSEAVSEQVIDQLDQVLGCAVQMPQEVLSQEAEALQGTVGQATNNAWLLWSNGNVSTNFTTPAAGSHTIVVRAWGSRAGSELPRMAVTIDDQIIGEQEVPALSDSPETYTFQVDIAQAGTHSIGVLFTNDFNDPPNNADRNLWVDNFTVTAGGVTEIERACVVDFIQDFAPKAWRRPLTAEELTRFETLYDTISSMYGEFEGIRGIIEAALQSPHFLYRLEYGVDSDEAVIKLSDYEMASRLSYFFWNSPPDEELLRAAAAGELTTDAGIEAQASRMVEDARSRDALNRAVLELLGVADFDTFNKGSTELDAELRVAMLDDTYAFVDHVLWEDDGRLDTLLTANYAFVNDRTAELYGLEAPGSGVSVRVDLDDNQRIGLLTQPALLARYGYGDVPIHRGLFLRETFFCNRPAPPPDELVDPPDTYEGQAQREKSQDRLDHNGCGGCHRMMDPMGLVYDPFDDLGRFREQDEHGNVLSSNGAILATFNTDTELDGPRMLAEAFAESDEVHGCFSQQWVRYALGRNLIAQQDACTLSVLEEAMGEGGATVQELFVAITRTDAFRYRRKPVPATEQ